MEQEKLQEIAFEIILHSGEARTNVHEAFAHMRSESYQLAQASLDAAGSALVKAHQAQTGLLQQYASGVEIPMEIIMVHAQDHLMTTMTLQEIAFEMLYLYQQKS